MEIWSGTGGHDFASDCSTRNRVAIPPKQRLFTVRPAAQALVANVLILQNTVKKGDLDIYISFYSGHFYTSHTSFIVSDTKSRLCHRSSRNPDYFLLAALQT